MEILNFIKTDLPIYTLWQTMCLLMKSINTLYDGTYTL